MARFFETGFGQAGSLTLILSFSLGKIENLQQSLPALPDL